MHDVLLLAAPDFTGGGLMKLLRDNWLPIAVTLVAVAIVFGANQRDWPGAVNKIGIVLLGLGVAGLATQASGVGAVLAGLI